MELFDQPVPMSNAVKALQAKGLLPTSMTSAELKALDAAIRRASMFSAQTTMESLLAEYKKVLGGMIAPMTQTRTDRVTAENPEGKVTTGPNLAEGRSIIQDFLSKMGYAPEAGKEGSLLDLSSFLRVNLVLKTNADLAWGAGSFVSQNESDDEVDLFPALELYRMQEKKVPRDWKTRWNLAARESGDLDAARALADHGRMVALKSSPIWQALGDGAGGYDDTLGNPFPPFAFNSGMWTDNVSRAEAVKLGLLDEGEKAKGAEFDFGSLFKLPAAA